jgi:sulfite exporter TauE/SafE
MNYLSIFMTGLITGGLTCLAVQGGLLAATLAQREEEKLKDKALTGHAVPILTFLIAKLIAYTLLGVLLGWFGSFFTLSLTTKAFMQFAVAIFMIGTALNLLDVHPIFRYFVIQPPKFLARLIRNQSKSKDVFAPLLLGAFTVFIPCGTTQAMMALAIGTGNPLHGAMTMFAFILGTSPIFFILGYFATKFGGALQEKFLKIAAFAIILIALYSLKGAINLTGSTVLTDAWNDFNCTALALCENVEATNPGTDAISDANITIGPGGYSPNNLTVKAGSKVTLHLTNKGGGGCAQAFTIPKLNIQKIVTDGKSDTVEFTAPNDKGKFAFMCSMGMYQGTIDVI